MKNKIFLVVLIILYLSCITQSLFSQKKDDENPPIPIPAYNQNGNEPIVTVLDFANETFFVSDVLGRVATTMYQSALMESKRFNIIDRTMFLSKVNELNLAFDQLTNDEILTICKSLNIQYLISGAVTEFGIKKTGTTVRTTISESNTKIGGGLSMEMGKGTARVAIDIIFTDVRTNNIVFTTSTIGTATSKNSLFGLELLLPIQNLDTGIQVGGGVEGFDETLAGKGIRNAARQLINNIITESNLYKW